MKTKTTVILTLLMLTLGLSAFAQMVPPGDYTNSTPIPPPPPPTSGYLIQGELSPAGKQPWFRSIALGSNSVGGVQWSHIRDWTGQNEFPTNMLFLLAYPYTDATNTSDWKAFTLTHWWTVTNSSGDPVCHTNTLDVNMPAGQSWMLGTAHVTNEIVAIGGYSRIRPLTVILFATNEPPAWNTNSPNCFTMTNVNWNNVLVQNGTNPPTYQWVATTNVINVCIPNNVPTNQPPNIQNTQNPYTTPYPLNIQPSGASGTLHLLGEPGSFWVLDQQPALGSGWVTQTNSYTTLDSDGLGTIDFDISSTNEPTTGFFRVSQPE